MREVINYKYHLCKPCIQSDEALMEKRRKYNEKRRKRKPASDDNTQKANPSDSSESTSESDSSDSSSEENEERKAEDRHWWRMQYCFIGHFYFLFMHEVDVRRLCIHVTLQARSINFCRRKMSTKLNHRKAFLSTTKKKGRLLHFSVFLFVLRERNYWQEAPPR